MSNPKEAEEIVAAIRAHKADAFVVEDSQGQQRDALQTAGRPYCQFFERIPEGALTLTAQGLILYCNPRFAQMVQAPREGMLGRSFADYAAAEDRKVLEYLLRDARAGNVRAEAALCRADGSRLAALVSTAPMDMGDSSALCAVVTELNSQSRYQEIERTARLKDDFLAMVSHELRIPLTSIIGWAIVLRNPNVGEAARKRALEVIERNARFQVKLIEDILDLSRIAAGTLRLEIEIVPIIPVLQAAIDTLRPDADAKQVRIETALDPKAGAVSGDPQRLQEVLCNLLSNAVKFTPGGGRVEVRCTRDGAHTEIKVIDSGEGIAPEFLPHIFDRFTQEHSATTGRKGGLGLGMAIVRHIVELHGGTVHAVSGGKGKGATFCLRLPVVPLFSSL